MIRLLTACLLLLFFASSSKAQERQWSFDQTDKDAYLVFGVPETDDVGLSFWCTQRSGWITLFVPEADSGLKPGRKTRITIWAGGKRFRYSAATTENAEAGTISVEARLPADDKLFAALPGADRIRIVAGKSEHIYPLEDVDFSPLLQLCRKG
jgi:hypothetical protein